jgi:hypothetical protein
MAACGPSTRLNTGTEINAAPKADEAAQQAGNRHRNEDYNEPRIDRDSQ